MSYCKQNKENRSKPITLTLKDIIVITACITICWHFEAIMKAFVTLFR